jgi:hypothetical protein
MTHVVWLVNLAPEIQVSILFLTRIEFGFGSIESFLVRPSLAHFRSEVQPGSSQTGKRAEFQRGKR